MRGPGALLSLSLLLGCAPGGDAPAPGAENNGAPPSSPARLCWPDYDRDGFGASGTPYDLCARVPGGVENGTDCDDFRSTVSPAAPELCDGLDNDCDGAVPADETDDDGDGFDECADLDCDDGDATRFAGALELCDGLDNDCDGVVPADELDGDGDGVTPCLGDCDDTLSQVHWGAPELCDGLDNDCTGLVPVDESDVDGDGFDICGGLDCDDTRPQTYPGASELCDQRDNDCDGALPADELDNDGDGITLCQGDCGPNDAATQPGAPEVCDWADNDCDGSLGPEELDDDGDGITECEGDCDDAAASTYPGAPEGCDGVDSDCDGPLGPDELDGDNDGVTACAGDCAPSDSTIYPGAPELCDGIDQDCDQALPTIELDLDGDGLIGCDDCDDSGVPVPSGGAELCDGLDSNCDGVLAGEADLDFDGILDCQGLGWAGQWVLASGDFSALGALLPSSWYACPSTTVSTSVPFDFPLAPTPWSFSTSNALTATASRTFDGACVGSAASQSGSLTIENEVSAGCPELGLVECEVSEAMTLSSPGLSMVSGTSTGWFEGTAYHLDEWWCGYGGNNFVAEGTESAVDVDATLVVPSTAGLGLLAGGGTEYLLDFSASEVAFYDWYGGNYTGTVDRVSPRAGSVERIGGRRAQWDVQFEQCGWADDSSTPPLIPNCADEPQSGYVMVEIRDPAGAVLQAMTWTFDGATDCDGCGDWAVDGVSVGEFCMPLEF